MVITKDKNTVIYCMNGNESYLKRDLKLFFTGSGLEPGGHFVHEGTTLLSHQQLRSRLAGEVGVDDDGDDGYKEDDCYWIISKTQTAHIRGNLRIENIFSNDYKEAEDCDE